MSGPLFGGGGYYGGWGNYGPAGPYGAWPTCGCSGCLLIIAGILLVFAGLGRMLNM
jgi:hypothetical protein